MFYEDVDKDMNSSFQNSEIQKGLVEKNTDVAKLLSYINLCLFAFRSLFWETLRVSFLTCMILSSSQSPSTFLNLQNYDKKCKL